MSNNPIVHWELMGSDAHALRDFYSGLFDWEFETPEGFSDYYTTSQEGMGVGGAVGQGMEEMPSYSAIYVQVEDIGNTLASVAQAGGETVVPRTEIPSVVTFALFRDPAGNLVGLVEPGP